MDHTLKDLAFKLDEAVGNISMYVETLKDIEAVFGQLEVDMDTAEHRGEEWLYYHEYAREVRILSRLMYYVMKDLNQANEKAEDVKRTLFEQLRATGDVQ